MYHEKENDKLVSDDGRMEIYPINIKDGKFKCAEAVEISMDSGEGFVVIPIEKLDDLIKGLIISKKLAL